MKAGGWPRRATAALAAAVAALLACPAAGAGAAASPSPQRAVMILLDVNESMAGTGFAAEREATLRYVRALPADVAAGLVTFSDHWRTALPPTRDHAALTAAVSGSRLSGRTSRAIYGAIAGAEAALRRLGPLAQQRLLVLTDAEELTGAAPHASIPADVITWFYERDDILHAAAALASASGGRYVAPVRSASLAAVFPSQGAAPVVAASRPQPGLPLAGVLAAAFVAIFGLALLAAGALGRGGGKRTLTAQIDRYGPRHAPPPPAEAEGAAARLAVGWAGRLLKSARTERGLAQRLDLAGISRKPAEWVVMGGSACIALSVVLSVVLGNLVLGVLAGILLGWIGMRLVLSIRIGRRRTAFSDQLPDVLQLIASSLQAGFSLPQALDAVVREGTQPTAGEFARALAEARIGADLEDALDGVSARMDSVDLRWTVMAIRIQREVGGNLAEVLRTTVGTMRERGYLRRQVRSLSAEGRLSAYILSVLPVVVAGWMFFIDPAYMRPLYTTVIGLIMIAVTLALYLVGVLWMRRTIKLEV